MLPVPRFVLADEQPGAPASCTTTFSHAEGEGAEPAASALLSEHTTLRVGGPARRLVVATSDEELVETVTDCDRRGEPVLVLGGGSNVLVSDDGFDGTVVRVATRGINAAVSDCAGANVEVAAGEDWDAFVAHAVAQEWAGVETLSGIPGLVGATPIQNVGAYGSDVSTVITSVRTWDRQSNAQKTFAAADCAFGYRSSRFKSEPGRYLVLRVGFQFRLGSLGAPIAYPELARRLGVEVGERVDTKRVREAVLGIRAGKGMVLDESDHDSWSAGSFFMNPLLGAEQAALLPPEAPRWEAGDLVKTSAAWLIQHAGFDKGFGMGSAALSGKHVLALTNRGGAKAADLVRLATHVRDGVRERFGVELVPEVNLIGVGLGS